MSGQTDLLDPTAGANPEPEPERQRRGGWAFDPFEAVARRKLGVGSEWEAYHYEALRPTTDVLIKGAVPTNPKAKPGRRRWDGATELTCVVTAEEKAAVIAEYERETAKCFWCEGTGAEWRGWSKDAGHSYGTCRHCAGTAVPASSSTGRGA